MPWIEDQIIGARIELGSHIFTAEEIIAFAQRYDPQPFHTDPEAARQSHFGGLVASGWHTAALWMRHLVQDMKSRAMPGDADGGPSPGFVEMRWPEPVRPGDVIAFSYTAIETSPSASKPDWGLVRHRAEAVNQAGVIVMSFIGTALMRKRPSRGQEEDTMARKGTMITLRGEDGFSFGAYKVAPPGPAKGGLILAMEVFGVTDHIKDLCDGFAADGYTVIAPALYERAERNFQASYAAEDIARARKHLEALMYTHTQGDIQAAIDALRADGLARIHIVGYCYGGSVAWLAACRCHDLTSAVGYYGRHIIDFVGEPPKCPTLLHFGNRDASIPLEWVDRIAKAHPAVIVHVYDAEHGFNSDRRQNYDEASAKLARNRTLEHFEKAGRT